MDGEMCSMEQSNRKVDLRSLFRGDSLLMCEQEPLGINAPAKAGQRLVRANDPVAGNDNRERVRAIGAAHGTACAWPANA